MCDSDILSRVPEADRHTFITKLCGQWLPPDHLSFRKLYKMSVHGARPRDFHTHCDEQGPTLTLIRTRDGCSCGGYTDASWDSVSDWKACAKAFIFSLVGPTGVGCLFPLRETGVERAIRCRGGYGPAFGDDELCVAARTGEFDRVVCNLGCSWFQAGSYLDVLAMGRSGMFSQHYRGQAGYRYVDDDGQVPVEIEVFSVAPFSG